MPPPSFDPAVLQKISPGPAAALAAAAGLSAQSAATAAAADARAFAVGLYHDRRWADLIRYLAAALPKREAVWWGGLGFWRLADPKPVGPDREALAATLRWLVAPGDDTRQAALKAAQDTHPRAPAFWLAQAAAVDVPADRAGSENVGTFVGGLLRLAAATADPGRSPEADRHVAVLGLRVAAGRPACPRHPHKPARLWAAPDDAHGTLTPE